MPVTIDLKGHQPPVRAERLQEILRQAEDGSQTALDYLHLLRAWVASQEALRQALAENTQNAERAAAAEQALADMTAERDSESRWAQHYFQLWQAAGAAASPEQKKEQP